MLPCPIFLVPLENCEGDGETLFVMTLGPVTLGS